jgi:SAM-dependent methyltransferase
MGMREQDGEVRRRVARTYGRIATDDSNAACNNRPDDTQATGCTFGEPATLPGDPMTLSLGCGNPIAFSYIAEGDVVLDLGCGAGGDLLYAAERVGAAGRVIGVDMTDVMIDLARRNLASAGVTNAEVRKGIIEDLPVTDSSVDWVISNCVINLSPNKPRAFLEIARVLKPGGRMSIADIVAEELPEWVLQSDALYDSCIAGAISEGDYLAGLQDAGLSDATATGRYVYDRDQLVELAATSRPRLSPEGRDLAEALVGRVWSSHFTATRPTESNQDETQQDNEPAGSGQRTGCCDPEPGGPDERKETP